jgi:hypothetical protein
MSFLMWIFCLFALAFAGKKSPYELLEASEVGSSAYYWKWFEKYPVDENMHIFIPKKGIQESYPVVLFMGGLGSSIFTAIYSDFLSETSYKGMGAIVIAWDALGVSNPYDSEGAAERCVKIYDFIKSDLQTWIDQKFDNPVKVNHSRIFAMGHSSGSRLATLLARARSLTGILHLDPVDADPFEKLYPILNSTMIEPLLPVVVMETELGPVPGHKWGDKFPPCCTPGKSALHFYDSYKSEKFHLFVKHYGHADILNDNVASPHNRVRFCASVEDPKAHPFGHFRNFVSGLSSSFIALYGSKDCSYKKYLTDSSVFPIEGTSKWDNLAPCGRVASRLFEQF